LANTPRQTFTLWTTYDLTPMWQVGGGVTSMSSRFGTTANIAEVPGYARFDAMVTYHQPKYDVSLNLYNLGDTFYYDQTAGSDGGRSVPGIGRTAMLTGRYRF
jgi:catecholate siderophore receptor